MGMKTTTTETLPLHTVTFQAANGMAFETYHCQNWNEFHITCQTMERLGWKRIGWKDRSGK